MWARHAISIAQVVHVPRSCGPCMKRPSLMWASVVMWSKSLAQVVHVPRSCGPGMHFRSLRWSMSLAHVAHARNVRRLCGPPSAMWPMHETSVAHVGPRRSCGPGMKWLKKVPSFTAKRWRARLSRGQCGGGARTHDPQSLGRRRWGFRTCKCARAAAAR